LLGFGIEEGKMDFRESWSNFFLSHSFKKDLFLSQVLCASSLGRMAYMGRQRRCVRSALVCCLPSDGQRMASTSGCQSDVHFSLCLSSGGDGYARCQGRRALRRRRAATRYAHTFSSLPSLRNRAPSDPDPNVCLRICVYMYSAYHLRYLGIGYTPVHPWHILALLSSVLPRRE